MSPVITMATFKSLISKRFILLNDEDDALDWFFMKFISLPTRNEFGKCVFIEKTDGSTKIDDISFKISNGRFVAWHTNDKNGMKRPFAIVPLLESATGTDIVGMKVDFNNGNNAYFSLEIEELSAPTETLEFSASLMAVAF